MSKGSAEPVEKVASPKAAARGIAKTRQLGLPISVIRQAIGQIRVGMR